MIDLDDLEKKAKAATPGPWDIEDDSVCAYIEKEEEKFILFGGWEGFQTSSDRQFVAGCNPKVVLELIEDIRRLKDENKSLEFNLKQKSHEIGRAEHRGNTVNYIYDKLENYSNLLQGCGVEISSLKQKLEVAVEQVKSLLSLGRKDTSNPKYDGYYTEAREALKKIEGEK